MSHRYHHPHPPFGYRYDLTLVREEGEQMALCIVARMTADGRGPTAIAAALTDAGLTNRKGRPYTKGSVSNLQRIFQRRAGS